MHLRAAVHLTPAEAIFIDLSRLLRRKVEENKEDLESMFNVICEDII
jgi:hypothetical protein